MHLRYEGKYLKIGSGHAFLYARKRKILSTATIKLKRDLTPQMKLFLKTPFCNFSDKDMAVLTLMRVGGIAKSALIEYGASFLLSVRSLVV
jgi:hypothetical protein